MSTPHRQSDGREEGGQPEGTGSAETVMRLLHLSVCVCVGGSCIPLMEGGVLAVSCHRTKKRGTTLKAAWPDKEEMREARRAKDRGRE